MDQEDGQHPPKEPKGMGRASKQSGPRMSTLNHKGKTIKMGRRRGYDDTHWGDLDQSPFPETVFSCAHVGAYAVSALLPAQLHHELRHGWRSWTFGTILGSMFPDRNKPPLEGETINQQGRREVDFMAARISLQQVAMARGSQSLLQPWRSKTRLKHGSSDKKFPRQLPLDFVEFAWARRGHVVVSLRQRCFFRGG